MSTHYLIDTFQTTWTTPLISEPRLLDTTETTSGSSSMLGGCVVVVPDYLAVNSFTGVFDPVVGLVAKKYKALLAYYTGYVYKLYDHLLDDASVNLTLSKGYFGDRGNISLPQGGVLYSVMQGMAITPPQLVAVWEAAQISTDTSNAEGLVQRTYTEGYASSLTVEVSCNNGVTWIPVQNGVEVAIPGIDQGNQLVVRMTNSSGNRLWLGGWAIIY